MSEFRATLNCISLRRRSSWNAEPVNSFPRSVCTHTGTRGCAPSIIRVKALATLRAVLSFIGMRTCWGHQSPLECSCIRRCNLLSSWVAANKPPKHRQCSSWCSVIVEIAFAPGDGACRHLDCWATRKFFFFSFLAFKRTRLCAPVRHFFFLQIEWKPLLFACFLLRVCIGEVCDSSSIGAPRRRLAVCCGFVNICPIFLNFWVNN